MKKLLRILALLCAFCLLLGLGVSAEGENWSEEYYRIIDYTDTLTDEETESLDADCVQILRGYQIDLALIVVDNAAQASMLSDSRAALSTTIRARSI